MDDLRGPNIQIVLRVREGLGFGFLKNPFLVSASLNGYILDTDPIAPCHAPVFDAELVWEADKRRFRNLRVQNAPIKVEVYSTGTQGRKNKVGYLMISLLAAQPCPSNKIVNLNNTWHKLLGVKSEGKCCHPQLLMSLSIEDKPNTPIPRHDLLMFHSNEVAYLSNIPEVITPSTIRQYGMSIEDFLNESRKRVANAELTPKLISEEGLIQIGDDNKALTLFVLSFVIGSAENIDLLLSEEAVKNDNDCHVSYSVFTHTINTDRVAASRTDTKNITAQFNQKTSLRLSTDLESLSKYFSECPYVITKICSGHNDIGICSMDLRKLLPTEDLKQFLESFCNAENALVINERCFILRAEGSTDNRENRKPYIDIEVSLTYAGSKIPSSRIPGSLTARSASQLCQRADKKNEDPIVVVEHYRSASCTQVEQDPYGNIVAMNTTRSAREGTDLSTQPQSEITEMIKKMYESFTISQEKLMSLRNKPTTSDMQVQVDQTKEKEEEEEDPEPPVTVRRVCKVKEKDNNNHGDTIESEKEKFVDAIPRVDRELVMKKFVEELEDWKERQQEIFRYQLKQKEEYHLDMLAKEWNKRRSELELKLGRGIEQCRNLANDLGRATEEFKLKGFRNTEREKKLSDAKKALEQHYTERLKELREASQKMEEDMKHQCKLKDMQIEELEAKVAQVEKQNQLLQTSMENLEKETKSKLSGLTKDQTASLIQELRCLEEKLDNATQSKAFFKEQWGRAVRELHVLKLQNRKNMLTQLRNERRKLGDNGLEDLPESENEEDCKPVDIEKLKNDFYVELLANTPPVVESNSLNSSHSLVDFRMDEVECAAPKRPVNEKLTNLIEQRDKLIKQDSPDEDLLKQLNHEIRNILINCGN